MKRRLISRSAVVAVLLLTAASGAGRAQQQANPAFERVALTVGRSAVLMTEFNVTRLAVTNPEVADATVVAPREVLIDGKGAGTVSLILWGDSTRKQYDIVVEPGVSVLQQQLALLFPGEDIQVGFSEEAIVLSGHVSSNSVMLRAAEIAEATSSKIKVINMLQLPGGMESQQVMLQVRFAEVNRRALTELGASLFSTRTNFTARSTTQQFAAPDFDDAEPGGLVFSDFLNLFFFNREEGIGAVVKALKSSGYFQSLAEPNLIAYNGQEASFLAGGEFPVPIVQGATGSVSVVFKEFGIRLTFTPRIAGDVIRLRVAPEVSSLDFANGLTLSGFRIPALTTRRAETEVELRDGQSFAIAGLLDNMSQEDNAGIPVLSSLPIIGNLFKSKAERAERTELMVLITPRLVRPLDPDEVPPLPNTPRRFIGPDLGEKIEGGAGTVDAPPPSQPKRSGGLLR
ncbi:MAG: type II and III secretion system protein family protein [Acidobacteria bacterium]|nr:type II and III secretion system protein family protein [Acidobacteriota bacterium]